MELPLRKDYPTYYKEIKKPQSFENIFVRVYNLILAFPSNVRFYIQKHLKRKEYHTSGAFAAEVELVFSNAFTFNQEHSPVWEDAMLLRVSIVHLSNNPLLTISLRIISVS